MTPSLLFNIIMAIIIADFLFDKYVDHLNAKHFDDKVPKVLEDVYDKEDYFKSQAYKKENYKFSLITSGFMILLTLGFFLFQGFYWVDSIARGLSDNEIVIALIFFGIIMFGNCDRQFCFTNSCWANNYNNLYIILLNIFSISV